MEDSTQLMMQTAQVVNLFNDLQNSEENEVIETFADIGFPPDAKTVLDRNSACFFKVTQLAFDKDYPHREAFENVLASLDNPAFNFAYVLSGTEQGIDLYIGIVKNVNPGSSTGEYMSANDYGKILKNAFEGNFNGSTLEQVKDRQANDFLLEGAKCYSNNIGEVNAGLLLGIPTVNKKDSGDEQDFQGIDRLINSMLGLEWRLVVVCEPVSRDEMLSLQNNVYELYNRLSIISKFTLQHSENAGSSVSLGNTHSKSDNKTASFNTSDTNGSSSGRTKGSESNNTNTGKNESHTKGWGESTGTGTSDSKSITTSQNSGSSTALTMELANKHAQDLMKYMEEELLERIRLGLGKGAFKTSVYYMAKEPSHAERLKVGLMSIFQGNKATHSPLIAKKLQKSIEATCGILQTYQNRYNSQPVVSEDARLLLSRPASELGEGLCTYLTASEISLLAGLPQTEVPGIPLKEIVNFGLNEKELGQEDVGIELGYMVQHGRPLTKLPFMLSGKSMAKHTFIAGVTGSGKTTTCHKLLSQAKMPFLVIEPAKTEYRTLINGGGSGAGEAFKDIVVFTLGNETTAPFRINPFELIPGEVISSHIDMVKATFTSAFPMEASMPQILEEAIYSCYEKKGWNIDTNANDSYGDTAFDDDTDSFPILSELLAELNTVVEEKGFGPELAANYKGSLISRLSNLTVGSKGAMLNCAHSTDFNYIAEHNVILEMEDLKSPEDKSLLMGFVLSRLSAIIKAKHKKNTEYKHLTLIEEAHRLLSKVEFGDSGSKKGAVETFTDLLAEVRKYGEGLIVVDQIPNKLAPEVLKNTNTKIIHKILAKDDKEAVGDTMLMDDKQKEYLSALETGNAVVFNEHTDKPVHVFITRITDTNESEIGDEVVRTRFIEKRPELGKCYEELEILPLYKLYDTVATSIAKNDPDSAACEQLKKGIEEDSRKTGLERKKIWTLLIRRRELLKGKALNNSKADTEKRIAELTDFYIDVFDAKNITKSDIGDSIRHYLT